MKDCLSVAGVLVHALALLTKKTFEPDFPGDVSVCTERMIAPRKEPYFFVQGLETEAKRSYPGFLITCKVGLQYCIPQPAEDTDYETVMYIAEKMKEILRLVVVREDVLAVWGKKITCKADAKGILATAEFTVRREALDQLNTAQADLGGDRI